MKKVVSLVVIILTLSACNTSQLISTSELERKNYQEVLGSIDESKANSAESVFQKPDKYALYPNGLKGIYEHIAKTTRYPKSAMEKKTQGKVIVEFIVEKNGKVKEAKILQSVSAELDKEALRVILSLERFYPGFYDNKPIRISYTQPINFKLN